MSITCFFSSSTMINPCILISSKQNFLKSAERQKCPFFPPRSGTTVVRGAVSSWRLTGVSALSSISSTSPRPLTSTWPFSRSASAAGLVPAPFHCCCWNEKSVSDEVDFCLCLSFHEYNHLQRSSVPFHLVPIFQINRLHGRRWTRLFLSCLLVKLKKTRP